VTADFVFRDLCRRGDVIRISSFWFSHMVFEHIEKLKRQYTDKYVVVDASRPELARFRDATGVVKTVNMNGRALVEFDAHDNIGWYDIELDFLKFIDKPLPKPEKKEEKPAKTATAAGAATKAAPASKPAAAPKPKAEVPATASPAAAPPGKMSTADIIAAARAKAGAGAAPAAKPTSEKPATPPAAEPAGKMSTAEILASARTKIAPESSSAPEASTAPEPVVTAPPAATVAVAKKPSAGGDLPTTTAEKIAWCRQHDAK
jgi:hypothetical protein